MSLTLFLLAGFLALLQLLLFWAMRGPRKRPTPDGGADFLEETGRRHVDFLPQIRQALAKTDQDFLVERGLSALQRRVRRERRGVALAYLSALRGDFQGLLRMARIIAVLSPEVVAVQELERLRLTVQFAWRYQMLRLELWVGFAVGPQLDGLSNLVSGLSVRMEAAMKELGERAALAAELASSLNRSGLNVT